MKDKTFTVVRHMNSLGCELAAEYCVTLAEIRKAVDTILDVLESGDSITFDTCEE